MEQNSLESKISKIESLLGYKLELCDHFTGLQVRAWKDESGEQISKEYFNVIIENQFGFSKIVEDLKRISNTYPSVISGLQSNGHRRVAVEIKIKQI